MLRILSLDLTLRRSKPNFGNQPLLLVFLLKLFHSKGPLKLMQRVKIARSFLQSVSNQFHVIILSLPM